MKTTRLLLFASVFGLLVAADAARAASSTTTPKPHQVEVNFIEPEKFTDVKDAAMGSDRGREHFLAEFREHLRKRAKDYLPEGYTLSVTITDIDLAGDFEPWRSGAGEIRIVRSNLPPRVNLSYELKDASGAVVKKGEKKLRDLMFEMQATADRSDPLRFEKEMLNDWLRSDFGELKKKK